MSADHCRASLGRLFRLLNDVAEGDVAARGHRRGVGAHGLPLGGGAVPQRLRRLALLHQLEDALFEVGLAAAKRGDLGLERLQLAGVGYLAGVEPFVVPVDANPDLFDVAFRAGELTVQVGQVGVRDRDRVPDLRRALAELRELGYFRLGAPSVVEPAQLGVQVG